MSRLFRGQPRPYSQGQQMIGPELAPKVLARIGHEHDDADHRAWMNPDGTRTVVCYCPCDTCWPADGGPCADSTAPC